MGILIYPCVLALGYEWKSYLSSLHTEEACIRNPSIIENKLVYNPNEEKERLCIFALVDITSCKKLYPGVKNFLEYLKNDNKSYFFIFATNRGLIKALIEKGYKFYLRDKQEMEKLIFEDRFGQNLAQTIQYTESIISLSNPFLDMDHVREFIGRRIFFQAVR